MASRTEPFHLSSVEIQGSAQPTTTAGLTLPRSLQPIPRLPHDPNKRFYKNPVTFPDPIVYEPVEGYPHTLTVILLHSEHTTAEQYQQDILFTPYQGDKTPILREHYQDVRWVILQNPLIYGWFRDDPSIRSAVQRLSELITAEARDLGTRRRVVVVGTGQGAELVALTFLTVSRVLGGILLDRTTTAFLGPMCQCYAASTLNSLWTLGDFVYLSVFTGYVWSAALVKSRGVLQLGPIAEPPVDHPRAEVRDFEQTPIVFAHHDSKGEQGALEFRNLLVSKGFANVQYKGVPDLPFNDPCRTILGSILDDGEWNRLVEIIK